jgi:hypothetical protein
LRRLKEHRQRRGLTNDAGTVTLGEYLTG